VPTELGSTSLLPGVYTSAAGTFALTGTLNLNGGGNPNAVFVFQAASTLVTAANSFVMLANGAQAKNVFWVVGSSATFGNGTHFAGTVMALSSITMVTGATIEGSLLARNGHVTLDSNTISTGACPTPVATPSVCACICPCLNPACIAKAVIYPSPARGDTATVAYEMAAAGRAKILVWNEAGDLVASYEEQKTAGAQKSRITISGFAAGIYLYKVSRTYDLGDSDRTDLQKFMVIR
jgi:hypothetical protein